MKNKYNNENFRRTFYETYGKRKGIAYEDFQSELDKIVKYYHEQDKHSYESKLCPKCLKNPKHLNYIFNPLDKIEKYKDTNYCVCIECGGKYTVHDRTN